MSILIGIDDTDNKESRGTGFHARQLAARLEKEFMVTVNGITRHQQLVHPDVPYTSQNSSACIEISDTNIDELIKFCRIHLIDNQVPGCDIGLCVAPKEKISKEIISFAQSVKKVVVNRAMARETAARNRVFLEGLCGTEDGIIGALSATGLRKSGNDGRFIWLAGSVKELRDLPEGVMTLAELKRLSGITAARTPEGKIVEDTDVILLNHWVRPILENGNAVLIVVSASLDQQVSASLDQQVPASLDQQDKTIKQIHYEWETAGKDIVRKLSD